MDLDRLSYEFLDLTNMDEKERRYLLQSLCESDTKDYLQLPWPLQKNDCSKFGRTKKPYNQNAPTKKYDLRTNDDDDDDDEPDVLCFGSDTIINIPDHISTLELHYMLTKSVQKHYEPQFIVKKKKIVLQPDVLPPWQTISNDEPARQIQQQIQPVQQHIRQQIQPAQQVRSVWQEVLPVVVETQTNTTEDVEDADETKEHSPGLQNKSWASLFGKPQKIHTIVYQADNEKLSSFVPTPLRSRKNNKAFLEDPFSYRLGEFLHTYELDFKTYSLLPRGLTNRSNYCYINSILQALISCSPFYNLLSALPSRPSSSGKSLTPIVDGMVTLIKECQPLSQNARVTRKEKGHRREDSSDLHCGLAFEPMWIYKMIGGSLADTFKVEGSQEDAEEFLGCLLNGLNDEMIKVLKLAQDSNAYQRNEVAASVVNAAKINDEKDESWKVMGPKNKGSITRRTEIISTPLSDIFRGQLRSRVHRAGLESTDNVQPFLTLQINIEKANSVLEALDNVVSKTKLDGVICSQTKQEVEAWQQVTLEELPIVLVLHLKCFDYKMDGCSKIIKALDFPIDLKIDSKLLSSKTKYTGKQKQYKLFAVVYHDGKEASKGHYVTDIYHVGYSRWVRFDDSSVKGVTETQVLKPQGSRVPYLLFYRRCDTIASQQQTTSNKEERRKSNKV